MAESTSVLKKISGSDYSTTNMEGPTPGLLVASSGSEEDRYLGNDEEDDGVVNSSSENDDLDNDDSDSDDDDDDSEGEDEPLNISASNQSDNGDGISDYEKLRLKRIARNQARLAQLGLLDHNKNNAKKKTTGPKKRERRKSYEGPARAQPKRGAKSNKPNLYTADALDVRKLRLSHGGGGGGYKYKHSCGECAGCAREDDCNTCYYCVQRAENVSYTRKCLFKQCRNKIKKQQGKTIKPTLITNDDGSFNIEDADKDNTNAEETDGKNAAGEDKEKENLTVDNAPDAVNSGNTADEKNSDEEKPTAKNIRPQHCDICEAPAKDDLIECGNCDRGFHSNCHFPKIKTLFHPGDFLCMDCNPRALVAVVDRKVIKVKLIEPAPPCMACHGDCPQTAPDESILCKACDNYIHLDCHDPPLDSKPRGGAARWWRCNSCTANNVPVLPQYQGNLGRPSGKSSGPKQSKPKKLNPNLKLFEGEHDDDCYICYNGGELVCCDFCSKAFHCACHIPALPKIPSGIWKCCECYASERTRKTRCGECEACMAEDCGTCHYCLDRPKFGGFNKLKKPCVKRNCPFQSFAEMAQPGKIPGQLDIVALTPSKRGRPPKKESKKRPLTSDTDSSSILEIATNKPKRMKIADASSEPPNVSKRSRISEADPSSSQGFTTTNNIDNKQMTAIAVIEPYKGPPLVEEKDRPLISDFLYLTLEQMRPTKLRLDDQTGCYRLQAVGSPGLACRHCYDEGVASNGRYFPASETSLSQSTTSKTIVGHVQRCHRCPIEVRERIESMQLARMGPGGKKTCAKIGPNGTPGEEKPKHGGRKLFFNRLWDRIQGLGAEVEDSISYIKFEALEVKENLQVDDNATNTSIDETSSLIFKVPKPTDTASIKVRKLIKGAYKNPDDSKVQDKAIEHLRKFATSSEDIDKIILAGGIEMMARAMQQHPDKSIVQAEACCTVGEMAWIQPQLANKLAHSGILNFIVSAMDHHRNNMKVQQMGCGAFRALSYDGANVQVIHDADGPAAVLKAMKNNPNKLLVQREGCCKYFIPCAVSFCLPNNP